MKTRFTLLAIAGILTISTSVFGQNTEVNTLGKGVTFSPEDKSYEVKIGARFQTLYAGTLDLETDEYSDQLLTRRARLKFDGFVYSPKIRFKIELGLTNRDTRNSSSSGIVQNSGTANIILDAVVKYKFADDWEAWFGQTKVPGNRERIISSQKIQFVDRSLVNSKFTLDRDIGVHLLRKSAIGDMVVKTHASITMGEGRDITTTNSGGYAYTGRVEFLPFGEFTSKGDYFGGDLEREETAKLSIAAAFDFNDGASRSRGQLGSFVYDLSNELITNDLKTIFIDAMFKSNGFSLSSEFASKRGEDSITGFGTGTGFVVQAGYILKNNIEPAFRITTIDPDNVGSVLKKQTQYTFGLSKYVIGHTLKFQTDISYSDYDLSNNELLVRFQVEVAF